MPELIQPPKNQHMIGKVEKTTTNDYQYLE